MREGSDLSRSTSTKRPLGSSRSSRERARTLQMLQPQTIAAVGVLGIIAIVGLTRGIDEAALQQVDGIASDPHELLNTYCVSCRGSQQPKGNVRLDTLARLGGAARRDLLKLAQEVVFFEELPPSKADQPRDAERQLLLDWLGNQLERTGGSKLDEREGHKTIGNGYTTLLNSHGNPIEKYGDLDLEMSRKKLAQTGAIQRFLT